MKIGIIVYSQTNNTLAVAGKLEERLKKSGHSVSIERVETEGEVKPGEKDIKFKFKPEIKQYEGVVFCSPVHAFSLPPAMSSYMNGISTMKGKKTTCFVTKNLPGKWTGGNRTINSMAKIIESKGGSVSGSGIICWRGKDKNPERDQKISDLVDELARLY